MFKKLFNLLLAAVLVVAVAGCGGSDTAKSDTAKVLKVGSSCDFAPFEFQGEKEYEGFDMDIIRAVGKEMGYQVEINNITFDGLIPALQAGNIDVAISGMTITKEREESVLFSAPYYESGLSIAVPVDNTTIKGFDDLVGKTVAVQIGTTSALTVGEMEGVTARNFTSSSDTFQELRAGGVDAVVNDKPVIETYLRESKDTSVRMLDELMTSENYGIAMTKDKAELKAEIDKALEKIKANGTYDEIYTKWFGEKK